ncbi:MAG: PIN domain-containing protein [Micropepsaceae bacterium]
MKPSYILVDFENVQPSSIGTLDASAFSIIFLVGARQRSMEIDVVQALKQSGVHYDIIRIDGNGKNALDFHIAYYIGRLSVESPGSAFHIISKDTGFDPLIAHLEKARIECYRWSAITDVPSVRAPHAKAAPTHRQAAKRAPRAAPAPKPKVPDRVDEMIENLEKRKRARPASLQSLAGVIKSHFRASNPTSAEIEAIIHELKARGKIAVEGEKVKYLLG